MTGKNQTYARQVNNQLVMRELREGLCSATMLSKKLNLSNAAISFIVAELQKNGYVKEVADAPNSQGLGRRPVYYTINENFGYVVVVSFSDYVAKIVVSDMKKNVIESTEQNVEKYDLAMLFQLVLKLKTMLSADKYRDMPLLGIDLSVPGRVNTLTGELQLSPQFDKEIFCEKNSIVNLFSEHFGVPVVMTNDTNLAAIGEMHAGKMCGVQNGMLVHIDEGVGGALILQGKPYFGQHGFAGEVGLMRAEFDGKSDALDEFVSLRAVREHLSQQFGREVAADEVATLFNTDEYSRKHILKTASCLGKVLKDIVELLDISTIVISGRLAQIDEYVQTVNAEVGKSINEATAVASCLQGNASVIGAVSKAVEALTDDIFK
ncbi:MAG: ROK family transcriptional regulator [Corallococcus sp.]|nr:ROK family transcriptional regulator [Corallococcus sp.]MCM1359586.1 ROK family transcriptional regulator [Corallococcus sp.]MCM1395178.1 ROK family transcriptional regulator [Corallococcus sp.]